MLQTHHRIRRLSISTTTEDSDGAFILRTQLRKCWDQVLPEFEQAFDGLVHEGQWLHIPKLELQLAVESASDLDSILPGLIRDALEKQFDYRRIAATKESHQFTRHQQESGSELTNETIAEGDIGGHGFSETSAVTDELVLLQTYLRSGQLPWYALGQSDWQHDFQNLTTRYISTLISFCLNEAAPDCYFRFLVLVDNTDNLNLEEIVPEILKKSNAEDQELLAGIVSRLLSGRQVPLASHQKMSFLSILLVSGTSRKKLNLAEQRGPVSMLRGNDQIQKILAEPAWSEPEIKLLASILETEGDKNGQTVIHENNLVAEISTVMSDAFPGISGSSDSEEKSIARVVYFAGLVLLHPYIEKYLKNNGIEAGGSKEKRIAEHHYEKAASLLYYLVTGEEAGLEYKFDIIKLFLGLPSRYSMPIAAGLISSEERKDADNLLESLISHWGVLKGTTASGLRETFLQRQGLLRKNDDSYFIKIERIGVDILLDQFPYSYVIVKLPWMQKPIHVEW